MRRFLAIALVLTMMFSNAVFAGPSMVSNIETTEEISVSVEENKKDMKLMEGEEEKTASVLWKDYEPDTAWYTGDKTEYTISTAEELAGLAKLVDDWAVKATDEEGNELDYYAAFEGVTIKLGADIDLYKENADGNYLRFDPIGSYRNDKAFSGTFDGCGYTISNLYQDTWALDTGYSYTDLGLGLFGLVYDATIMNLTVDGTEISGESAICGTIAATAYGDCTFENITVKNANVADYQYYSGGLVGWASGNHEYVKCVVDETTTVAAQWGDFDNSVGGVIGGCGSSAEILFKECNIACRIDAYSDVTSSYQWFAYRRSGMLIGNPGKTAGLDGTTYAVADQVTVENCKITIGEWANYTYCEFAGKNWPWVRVQEGISNSAYSNPRYGHPTDANGNEVVDDNHVHNDGEGHFRTIAFNQLFGGGQGVYGSSVETLKKLDEANVANGGEAKYTAITETLTVVDEAKIARSPIKLYRPSLARTLDGYILVGSYETLEEALADAQAGDKIVLTDDIKLEENVDVPADVVLTLNGYSIDTTEVVTEGLVGEGTEDSTYLITSLEDLVYFRDSVNAGNNYAGKHVKLCTDIDLENNAWTPIGTSNAPFNGYFDGGNHTVSNLNVSMAGQSNVGFFGRTNNGEIENLNFNNATVTGRLAVGVVAGTPYTAKYTNIKITGHVEVNGMSYVGGALGRNAYADVTGITIDVDDTSYVKADSVENGIAYRTYVGGVIGFMGEGGHKVSDIYSNIKVIGTVCDVGGILGILHYGNTLENVTSDATVVCEAPADEHGGEVGGIVGVWHNEAGTTTTMSECYFNGKVEADGVGEKTAVGAPYNTPDANSGKLENTNKYIAEVDGVQYETFADAFNAVQENGTITFISDVTVTEETRVSNNGWYEGAYYIGDKSFTMDLNGYVLTHDGCVNDYFMLFKNDGAKANEITIKNGTVDAGTAYSAVCTASTNAQQITINLENVELINNNANGATVKVRGGTVLNVNNGTVITGKDSLLGIECYGATANIYDGAEIYQNGASAYMGCLVGVGADGTVNVYGGNGASAKGAFIAMTSGGIINVYSGEWVADTDGTNNPGNDSVLIAQNDKQSYPDSGDSVVNVYDGIFTGSYNCYGDSSENAKITIYGGEYTEDPTAYLAPNTVLTQNGSYYRVDEARTIKLIPDAAADTTVNTNTEFTLDVYINGVEAKSAKWELTFEDTYFDLVGIEVDATYTQMNADELKPEIICQNGTIDTTKPVATYTFKSKLEAVEDSEFKFVSADIRTSENVWEDIDVTNAITTEMTVVTVELREINAKVYNNGTEVTGDITEQHDANTKYTITVKGFEDVNGTETELTDATIVYELNGSVVAAADLEDLCDVGEYVIDYTISKAGYEDATGTFTLTINYNQYDVEVTLDGTEITGTEKEILYDGNEHFFNVTAQPADPAVTTITYTYEGVESDTAPVIKGVGTYEITYKVDGSAAYGYEEVTGTVTITVKEPVYHVEVARGFGVDTDYVDGVKLVLVYTDAEGVSFDFDGVKMFDVTEKQKKYLYNGNEYEHVYALAVDASLYAQNLDAYDAEISLDFVNAAPEISFVPENDINLNGSVTWDDITATYTVVENDKYAFARQMAGFIKADTNGDKKVTALDATPIIAEVYGNN